MAASTNCRAEHRQKLNEGEQQPIWQKLAHVQQSTKLWAKSH